MTCILLFNFKRFCFLWVTVWDSVRHLLRALADLHFSPQIAFQGDCLFLVWVWDPVRQLARGDGDLYFSPKLL